MKSLPCPGLSVRLDCSCLAAEHALFDQRLFVVADGPSQTLEQLVNRLEQENSGFQALFSRQRPRAR